MHALLWGLQETRENARPGLKLKITQSTATFQDREGCKVFWNEASKEPLLSSQEPHWGLDSIPATQEYFDIFDL